MTPDQPAPRRAASTEGPHPAAPTTTEGPARADAPQPATAATPRPANAAAQGHVGGGGALADAARPAAGRGTVRTHRPAPGDPTPPGPGPAGAGHTGSWPTYERIKAPLARRGNALHAGAWWLWALGLATAASRTTNPLLLGLIVGVAGYVVAARRTSAPWARSYSAFLKLGLFVIGLRLFFSVLLGSPIPGAHTLFALPELPLPAWAAQGIRVGGRVTAEQLVFAFYDGAKLAALLVCVGAANALANPARLLKSSRPPSTRPVSPSSSP